MNGHALPLFYLEDCCKSIEYFFGVFDSFRNDFWLCLLCLEMFWLVCKFLSLALFLRILQRLTGNGQCIHLGESE